MTGLAREPVLTLEQMREQVAELLDVPAATLLDHVELTDQGLNSVQLMVLAERWRAAGAPVSFGELAERPLLTAWAGFLARPSDGPG